MGVSLSCLLSEHISGLDIVNSLRNMLHIVPMGLHGNSHTLANECRLHRTRISIETTMLESSFAMAAAKALWSTVGASNVPSIGSDTCTECVNEDALHAQIREYEELRGPGPSIPRCHAFQLGALGHP